MELSPQHVRAPELYGDFWFNSDPVSLRALRGYVILLDFWDYSCVNCIRALPYIKEWHRKYQEYGLGVIGIHTPEFKFGKKPENVERAIREAGIAYPVVMDNEALIWSGFANRSWPTKHLIDKDGYVRYKRPGEGGYEEFERAIQALLSDAGVRGELPPFTEPIRETDRQGAVCYRPTGEIYLGYLRGTIGNVEGYSPESTVEYSDPGLYMPGRFYVQGAWREEKEFIRFNSGGVSNGYIVFSYEASEVNGVLGLDEGKSCELIVEQDGKALTSENKG
ncbi:MAG: redoxin domain-containing protein, partial [Bacteroidota bacterium]